VLPSHRRREIIDQAIPLPVPDPHLAHRSAASPVIRPLVDFNSEAQGLADRLVWNMKIDPTTMLNRDFAFSRAFLVRAKRDLSWAPRAERNKVADKVNVALRELHDGWMVHGRIMRHEIRDYPTADYPDAASWLVGEERKIAFESGAYYSSDIFWSFTYLPPPDGEARLDAGLYTYEQGSNKNVKTSTARLEAEKVFEQGVARIQQILQEDLEFDPLGLVYATDANDKQYLADEQLSLYLRELTGRRKTVRAMEPGTVVSEYLAQGLTRLENGILRVGDNLVKPITVVDHPEGTTPDLLDALEQIPGNFSVCFRWIGRNPEAAQKEMRSLFGRALQKRQGMMDALSDNPNALQDPEAMRSANDARDAYGESRSRDVSFGYYTLTAVCYEPIVAGDVANASKRVSAIAATIIGRLEADGFNVASDHGYELETFLGQLDGDGYDNLARGMLSSRNLANLLPTVTLWTGDWHAPDTEHFGQKAPPLAVFAGHGATPFAFNCHVPRGGGHTLLVGETGDGKTTLAGFLISEHRKYRGSQQIIIDSQHQHWVHAQAIGADATCIELTPQAEHGLSPLSGSDPEHLPAKEKLIAMMIREQGLDPREYGEMIFTALVYLMHGPLDRQTVSGLMSAPGISAPLRNALRPYSRDGIAGRLFDNPARAYDTSMTVFETGELKDNRAMYTIALSALDIEITRMCQRRKPTMIAGEEFWHLLKHPIGADLFAEGLREKRRSGGHYLLLTQSITDVDDGPHTATVLGSCKTKIILPNQDANGEYAERYERLGLAPWEREALVRHVSERAAYIIQPHGRRMIDTRLGPVALAKVGQSTEKAITRAEDFLKEFGDDFFPELVFAQFEPEKSEKRREIAETWRRHAYFFPRRFDDRENPQIAPSHPVPHSSDPYGPYIDQPDLIPTA
jgi:type IV secretory pathway VirB4 component